MMDSFPPRFVLLLRLVGVVGDPAINSVGHDSPFGRFQKAFLRLLPTSVRYLSIANERILVSL
jgi:hypothetical protein